MHTITSLRKTLGLSTTNQVRNRIEAIKDVLGDHLRRGPNNQILLTDEGVERLRDLQELYDSGLTMKQASELLRAKSHYISIGDPSVSQGTASHDAKPERSAGRHVDVDEELADLRQAILRLTERLASLEGELRGLTTTGPLEQQRDWWERLREDADAS